MIWRHVPPPALTDEDRSQGLVGTAMFYGFGDDGSGGSDAVLSGKLAWEYACRSRKGKTWQCEYIDFKNRKISVCAPKRPPGRKDFTLRKFSLAYSFRG